MHVLIINAHLNYLNWSEGTLNKSMVEVATAFFTDHGHTVTKTHIEDGYDADQEVQKHVAADLAILQTPINWFGAPWIYKKYVDEVFNSGFHSKILLDGYGRTRSDPTRQYGTGGHMRGKKFMISATWNAPTATFDNPDISLFAGKGVDDLLLHITSNYKFSGYDILPQYGMYYIFKADLDIAAEIEDYKKHLETCF